MTKKCPSCLEVLEATTEFFYRCNRTKGGLYYLCKNCRKAKEKERRGSKAVEKRCKHTRCLNMFMTTSPNRTMFCSAKCRSLKKNMFRPKEYIIANKERKRELRKRLLEEVREASINGLDDVKRDWSDYEVATMMSIMSEGIANGRFKYLLYVDVGIALNRKPMGVAAKYAKELKKLSTNTENVE